MTSSAVSGSAEAVNSIMASWKKERTVSALLQAGTLDAGVQPRRKRRAKADGRSGIMGMLVPPVIGSKLRGGKSGVWPSISRARALSMSRSAVSPTRWRTPLRGDVDSDDLPNPEYASDVLRRPHHPQLKRITAAHTSFSHTRCWTVDGDGTVHHLFAR